MLKNLQSRYRKLSEEAGSYGRPRTAAGQNLDMEMATDLLNEVDGYDAEVHRNPNPETMEIEC
jgi:hypothetical protein